MKKISLKKKLKKGGKNSKKVKVQLNNALQGLSRVSRNHHMYGVGIGGIPPTTAKRTVVKGTTKIEKNC